MKFINLILSSGFSTAEKVSDISGRGVGLDVVKSTIESLGGTVFRSLKRKRRNAILLSSCL